MLSREYGKHNKGRNRILTCAVCLCIVTLGMVFGITTGKAEAEYIKSAREAGTTASACIEGAGSSHYQKVRSLGYVKRSGRRVMVGWAADVDADRTSDNLTAPFATEGGAQEETGRDAPFATEGGEQEESGRDAPFATEGGEQEETGKGSQVKEPAKCGIQLLDAPAWEEIISPAYTNIHGHYPKDGQEVMLPVWMLKAMGIEEPEEGLEIDLEVSIGLFRKEQERFILSGWYTDHIDSQYDFGPGYISEAKYKEWGYDIGKKADILICQSDGMDWRKTEERLYQDVTGKGENLRITAANTFAGDAVNRMAGGFEMAVLGAVIILCGMFFLIYNVMQISMAGDVRQMGLLNTIGATKRQIRSIYFGQIRKILILGVTAGTAISAFVLCILIPEMLGSQYLRYYKETGGLKFFRPGILAAAVGFAVVLTAGVSAGVICRVVNVSCVESMKDVMPGRSVLAGRRSTGRYRSERPDHRKRSAGKELWYMAWQNLGRNRGRFLLTVFSLFLGMEAFLGTIVITKGSDYIHAIEKRPDFLIAGKFSDWGQAEGYGNEYKSRDAGEDPMESKGGSVALLSGNWYDEFSPISQEVREELLSLDGVDKEQSYVMEGAYMTSTMSQKAIDPLLTPGMEMAAEKEEIGHGLEYDMIEGFEEDVIQILKEEELLRLQKYVKENDLPVDMESLAAGDGVMILHDHQLTPNQEKQAKESVGEPVYFTTMRSKEDFIRWNQADAKERDSMADRGKRSETFVLSGYMDNRAEGFPHIRQTWHGAEGTIYYLISEKGFEKLPTRRKTLYMELSVDEEKERQVKTRIHEIISREELRRKKGNVDTGTETEQEETEAGIFCISKSDLRAEAASAVRGNRRVLGSISIVLLLAGLTNYFNVMITGILARRKEFEVMESIGMTRKQKKKLLMAEGMYYCIIVGILMLTAGSGLLRLVCRYMEGRLSYFESSYPLGWMLGLIGGLTVICVGVAASRA